VRLADNFRFKKIASHLDLSNHCSRRWTNSI